MHAPTITTKTTYKDSMTHTIPQYIEAYYYYYYYYVHSNPAESAHIDRYSSSAKPLPHMLPALMC